MRVVVHAVSAVASVGVAAAFSGSSMLSSHTAFAPRNLASKPPTTSLKMGFDPSLFSSVLLSDASDMVQSASAALSSISLGAADATVADVAQEAASTDQGWFGFLTYPIELLLQTLHSVLVGVGVSSNAWGISIIALTVLIKLLTYPLTRSQLESTNKMQMLQPKIKEIQAKYQSNPQVMNEKVAAAYQEEEVNPLAGCLPALVQLPVFIGLYRAILELAKENKLEEAFLFLPNLEGPTYGADPATASDWILKGWVNGVPPLGWEDTTAFLILPVVLIISQYISQALITPKNQDPSQQQANVVLQILPVMIGWFSLNVPAALGIYWISNNIISTLITLQIRSGLETAPATASGSSTSTVDTSLSGTFRPAPIREKPSGFAAPVIDAEEVKPITTVDVTAEDDEGESEEAGETASTAPKKKRGGKKKRKN